MHDTRTGHDTKYDHARQHPCVTESHQIVAVSRLTSKAPKTALSHFRWWRFVASAEEDAVACSLNYGDNAAVQEAVQPPRRTAIMSGKSSLAGP